jgi:perosamine synthetase
MSISIAHPMIEDEEKQAVMQVLESGMLAQGPRVREFEEHFAEFVGSRYAVATSNGTSALHLALLAHGIGPGDEVITTPFSFVASANCALYVGARPVFVDIEPQYFTIDPAKIEAAITPLTKAIIPVHLFGQTCDMDVISKIAHEHRLVIIEDACQAHWAMLGEKMAGTWGTACYSFYPTKNITTGEGGMITTDDPEIANCARLLRDHGSPKRYYHEILGYNMRLNDILAAIGLAQLPKLPVWNQKRIHNAAYLTNRLQNNLAVTPPSVRPGAVHVFHQYTVRVKNRDAAIRALTEHQIGYGIYYPRLINQQPIYQNLGYTGSYPMAEQACQEVLSLPIHPSLTSADLDSIAEALKEL